MGNGERWERRIGDVALTLTRRGLVLQRGDGVSIVLREWPTGWDFIWNIEQPCHRCGSGRLRRLTLDGNRAVLGCDRCSHTISYYADVSVAEVQN